DCDRFHERQESHRCVPPAGARRRRHGAARYLAGARVPRRLLRGRQVWIDRRCGLLRLAGGELARGVFRRPRPRACHRRQLPHEGRDRRAGRARDRRARAAQSRPYVRPCARGGGGLFRSAAARRGDCDRHGARLRILRQTLAAAGRRRRTWRAPPCGRRAADPGRRHSGRRTRRRPLDGADRAGQEGQAWRVDVHPGARHRRQLHRARRRRRRGPRLSREKARRAMTGHDWLALLIVFVCILLSAFFSGSETALTASSRASMLRLEKQNNREARIVNRLLDARERMIGALLFGNNAANIAASSLATGLLLAWFGDVGVIYATIVMTVLIVVFAEVLPKT